MGRYGCSTHDRLALAGLVLLGLVVAPIALRTMSDDVARYMALADAIRDGSYVVWTRKPDEATTLHYLFFRPPLYGTLAAIASLVLGPTLAALYVPIVAAGIVFPPLLYLLLRECRLGARPAFLTAVLPFIWEPVQVGVFGIRHGEAVLLVATTAVAYGLVRLERRGDSRAIWVLGVGAAGAVLTRPEGALFVAIVAVAILWWVREDRDRIAEHRRALAGGIGCLGVSTAIVATISYWLTGDVWHSSYQRSALSIGNLEQNIVYVGHHWTHYLLQLIPLPGAPIVNVPLGIVGALLVAAGLGVGGFVLARRRSVAVLLAGPLVVIPAVNMLLPPLTSYTIEGAVISRHFSPVLPAAVVFLAVAWRRASAGRDELRVGVGAIAVLAVVRALRQLFGPATAYTTAPVENFSSLWVLLARPYRWFSFTFEPYRGGRLIRRYGAGQGFQAYQEAVIAFYDPYTVNVLTTRSVLLWLAVAVVILTIIILSVDESEIPELTIPEASSEAGNE